MRSNASTPRRIAKILSLLIFAAVVAYGASSSTSDRARTRLVEEAQLVHPSIRSAAIEDDDLILVSHACSDEWLESRREELAVLAREADIAEIRCRE